MTKEQLFSEIIRNKNRLTKVFIVFVSLFSVGYGLSLVGFNFIENRLLNSYINGFVVLNLINIIAKELGSDDLLRA